jgi:eukaryotic-like serine/threonine-protein kinase
MIGKTISKYKILEKVGEGGMGIVYKAQDLKLDRFVAIKFLPHYFSSDTERKKRFIHEAKTASSLDHSNIGTIHELSEDGNGQMYIVMAYYDGESLKDRLIRKPLEINEAIEISVQVANGLVRAHEAGIIHRDIKPANIIITKQGEVKIIDFGLAKRNGDTQISKDNAAPGTIAYMAPEQVVGNSIDSRTDIWSFGVVLYEMITGELPFKGEFDQAVIYSILKKEPITSISLRTGIPFEIEQIINKALVKKPEERFSNMDEFLTNLQSINDSSNAEKLAVIPEKEKFQTLNRSFVFSIFATLIIILISAVIYIFSLPANKIDSIAVLPLENLSEDPEQEFFVDGMHAELHAKLAGIGALTVISRTTVMQYKGVSKTVPEIGKELQVDAVVEWAAWRVSDSVRFAVHLIDAANDRSMWSETYSGSFANIPVLQSEIVNAISQEIKVELTPQEELHLVTSDPVDSEAYDIYLKGLYIFNNNKTKDGFEKAIQLYQQCALIDSSFAPAYAGLANVYNTMGVWGILNWQTAIEKARHAAYKALELDDSIAEAHISLAMIKWFEWNWSEADREWNRAYELNPGVVIERTAYLKYLQTRRLFDERNEIIKRYRDRHPLSLNAMLYSGATFSQSGQYAKALEKYQSVLDINPNQPGALLVVGMTLICLGEYDKALSTFEKYSDLAGRDDQNSMSLLGLGYALAGQNEKAIDIVNEMIESYNTGAHRSPVYIAGPYIALGEVEQAMYWLKKAFEVRDPALPTMLVEFMEDCPNMLSNTIVDDPRFIEIVKNVGFK